jgi:hypothetical protein
MQECVSFHMHQQIALSNGEVQVGPHVGLLVVTVSGALNLKEFVDFWEGCALSKLSLYTRIP